MGIFQGIYSIGPQGQKYRKSQSRLERAQINARIQGIQNQINFRKKEDPREHSQLKHSAWGRGLGKSSIAEQDKERLSSIQKIRNADLSSAMHVAVRMKQYLKKKRRHERNSAYLAVLDELVSMVPFFGGSGGQTPEASGGLTAQGGSAYPSGLGTEEFSF